MASKRHWKDLTNAQKHPEADTSTGCLFKHVTGISKSPTFPACGYKYNSIEETKDVSRKRSLYELDADAPFKGSWRIGPRLRLTVAERLKGKSFETKSKRGNESKSGTRDSHTPINPIDEKDAWNFDKGENYKTEIRPFKHEHHHILPTETVLDYLEKPMERKILWGHVKYNINSRLNMIILPCTWDVARVLGLPRHAGRHGKGTAYAARCTRELNKFKARFDRIRDEKCKETKARISAETKRELDRLQQQIYWLLVKWGRAEALAGNEAHINQLPTTLTM